MLALVPGICEELLFRGLFMSGLRQAISKWSVMIAVGLTFAVYHYLVQRFVVTVSLGVLLAYLCWQSRSIFPAMIAHIMHNTIQLLLAWPASAGVIKRTLLIPTSQDDTLVYLPWHLAAAAAALLVLAFALLNREREQATAGSNALGDPSAGAPTDPALDAGELEHSGAIQN